MRLALRLVEAGLAVTLLEADAHDARRRRDLLDRVGAGRIAVAVGDGAGLAADLWIGPGAPRAPGVLHLRLGAGPLGHGQAVIDVSAPDLRVIEILAGSDPRAAALARLLGAQPVTLPALLTPRLLARLEDAVESLVLDGAAPCEVDAVAEAAGFSPGPCAAQDQRGLARRPRALPLVARMIAEGRLGRAAGVGWYRYPGGGGRVIDPLIEDMAREEAHFAGHPVRSLNAAEIVSRLRAALTEAGAGTDPAALAQIAAAHGLPIGAPA